MPLLASSPPNAASSSTPRILAVVSAERRASAACSSGVLAFSAPNGSAGAGVIPAFSARAISCLADSMNSPYAASMSWSSLSATDAASLTHSVLIFSRIDSGVGIPSSGSFASAAASRCRCTALRASKMLRLYSSINGRAPSTSHRHTSESASASSEMPLGSTLDINCM